MQIAPTWKHSYRLLFRPRFLVCSNQLNSFVPKLWSIRSTHSLPNSGLLSLPSFKSADDFLLRSAEAMKLCSALREEVSKEVDPLKTLLLLDQISNEVCSVLDVAEFCRNAHDDEEYREKAEHAFSTLSLFIHNLNTDITLYTALQRIVDTESIIKMLPEEHKLFAKDLKSEFESGGIHLLGNKREESVVLQGAVIESETKFVRETSRVDESSYFNIGPFQSKKDHARFSSWLRQYVQQSEEMSPDHVTCSPNRRIGGALIRSLDEEPHRETVWMHMVSQPANNVNTLGQMIKDRQVLAKALGFESFAHKYLANKVLKTPQEVNTFLTDVAATVRPKAQKQLESLKSMKRAITGNKGAIDLKPWDISYLSNMAVLSQDNGKVDTITEYLPLNSCIEGLIMITESLFGIKVCISDVIGPEAWLGASSSSSGNPSHSNQSVKLGFFSGAIKCDFVSSAGDSIGTVFLDLFNRPVKFPGAAHFYLRCGCSNTTKKAPPTNTSNRFHSTDEYQLPVVALSFNFSPPPSFSNKIPLLTLDEIETLHHEWGHALHSMLSRTTFQHLSGTRGATDFVEVPSHLFEHYARTPAVISMWAKHSVTGKPIPPGMLEEAFKKKESFSAIDFQTQILYSAADQFLFGPNIGDVSKMTPNETYQHALSGIARLQVELTDLPLGNPTLRNTDPYHFRRLGPGHPCISMLTHSHFVNYGGGYYSYIYAQLQSAQIWKNVFEKDPLSREGGLFIWQRMLRFGAAKDTKEILAEAAGGPLEASHYMDTL